jgi:cation transport regulator ChaC
MSAPYRRHPSVRFRLVLWLSRLSLRTVVLIFIVVSFALSAAIAGLLTATSSPRIGFDASLRSAISNAWNPGDLLDRPDQSFWFYTVAWLDALVGVLLPTLLLGAFVSKMLQHDPLVWRRTVSVERDINGLPVLRFRFYNGTRSPIVRTRVEVYARVRITGNPGTLYNYRLDVQLRDRSSAPNEFWPFGRPGVPYLVSVPLGGPMTVDAMESSDKIFIPAYGEPTERALVSFFVIADGVMLDTSRSFVSTHEYRAGRDFLFGHYQEISADYTTKPRRWAGWDNFDGSSDMFVFAYASLTSLESARGTLGRPVDPATAMPATLSGWRREWNVASDQDSHPERTIQDADGSRFDGAVAVMGIVRGDSSDHCNGIVLPVTTEDLAKLDRRERNYRRVDVTQAISFDGKPSGCVIFTYVPLAAATERMETAKASGRSIVIRRDYVEQIEDGFKRIGEMDIYHKTTPSHPFPVRDLHFAYRAGEVSDVDDAAALVPDQLER